MRNEDPDSGSGYLIAQTQDDRSAYHAAVRALWERYFKELVRRASTRLGAAPRSSDDGEDVAVSAFFSLVERTAEGRFARLSDRHDLWKLLITITARKAALQFHRLPPTGQEGSGLENTVSQAAAPDYVALLEDELRCLKQALNSDCRAVAEKKLQGFTNQEIAENLGWTTRRVERKLSIIRDIWASLHPDEPDSERSQ